MTTQLRAWQVARMLGLIGLSLGAWRLAGAAPATMPPTWPMQAKLLQRLRAFNHPEGSIFSADGQFVFVSNSAELGMPKKGLHWIYRGGYISKLKVQPDGTLSMVAERLVTGLTGPLGMAVSTVATRRFPSGTIFVTETWAYLAQADGTEITDAGLIDPEIVAFAPDGKVLGTIKFGPHSAVAKRTGVAGIMGNALGFDKSGNLYMTDTGVGANYYVPRIATSGGGVYRFPVTSLDPLAANQDAAVDYVATPNGGPDGIEVAPDGTVHFNTVGNAVGLTDPAAGGQYKLTAADFAARRLPPPFGKNLGALDGCVFAGDKRLDTEVTTNSILVTPLSGHATYVLGYDQPIVFQGPADIASQKLPDGSYLLIVPELAATSSEKPNTVTVIRLPADF